MTTFYFSVASNRLTQISRLVTILHVHQLKELQKRSYEIISENYCCVRHKNSPKHNQHVKQLFFELNSYLGP